MSDAERRAPLEQVELFESEIVAGRGRQQTHYLVRFNDGWVSAREHPGAKVESLDTAPGTVWERRIELELPRGTRLVRVVSSPLSEPRREPLDYLKGRPEKPRRRVRRTELSVGARGALRPVARRDGGASG